MEWSKAGDHPASPLSGRHAGIQEEAGARMMPAPDVGIHRQEALRSGEIESNSQELCGCECVTPKSGSWAAGRRPAGSNHFSSSSTGIGTRVFVVRGYTETMDWSRCAAVDRDPDKLSGVWCFRGTRLPVATLFEYIDRGSTIGEFLEAFPSVTRGQVHDVLAFAKDSLESPAAVA